MNPTYHRGAVVQPLIFFKGERIVWDRPQRASRLFQWDDLRDKSSERTAAQLAAVSKPSRQRRKGAITRYGVKR